VDAAWPIVTNTDAIAVNQAWYGFSGNLFGHAAATTTIALPKSATPSRSAKYGGKADPVSVTLPDYQVRPAAAAPSEEDRLGPRARDALPRRELPASPPQLFAKPLNATAMAVFAVNHAATPTLVTVSFASVPGLNYVSGSSVALYDVWAQAPAGSATTSWSATLASHDSAFLILNGEGVRAWEGFSSSSTVKGAWEGGLSSSSMVRETGGAAQARGWGRGAPPPTPPPPCLPRLQAP